MRSLLAQVQLPETGDLLEVAKHHGLFGVDGAGLLIVGLFAILGLFRGLWWQVIRLLGLLGAALLARGLAPHLAGGLEDRLDTFDPRLIHGVLWLVTFIAGIAAFAALGRFGRKALSAMKLGTLDRLGGCLAGAVTGLIVHAALVAGLLQVGSDTWAAESVLGTRSGALVEILTNELPLLYERTSTAVGELQEAGLPTLDGDQDGEPAIEPAAPADDADPTGPRVR